MKYLRVRLIICLGLMNWIHPFEAAARADSSGLLKIHLDMRGVVSQEKRLRMGGASVGWEWGVKRDEVTLGYYWTGNRGRKDIRSLSEMPFAFSSANTGTDIRFASAGYWLTITDKRRWKLSAPLEAGVGRAKFYSTIDGQGITEYEEVRRVRVFPLQAAAYGEWKATRWLGTGLQAGYRHYISNEGFNALKPLNGFYYRFRVLVYMQTFYDWRNHLFRGEPLPGPFYPKSP